MGSHRMTDFDPGLYSWQQYISYEFYDECGAGRSQKNGIESERMHSRFVNRFEEGRCPSEDVLEFRQQVVGVLRQDPYVTVLA